MAASASSLSLRKSSSSTVRFARFAIRDARESSTRRFFAFPLPLIPSLPSAFDPLVSITLLLNANSFAIVSPSRLSRSFLFAEDAVPDFRYLARLASTAPTPLDWFDFFRSPFELPGLVLDSSCPVVSFSCILRVLSDDSFASDMLLLLEEDVIIFGNASCPFSLLALFISHSGSFFVVLSFSVLRLSTSASTFDERNLLSLDRTS
mmetsp:Transcript_25356/g.45875  ORF Transcript_25356/g.45875 Transcript_25356/m.45875 type:complete len:206 (-) Transcript_25356:72-689(-)